MRDEDRGPDTARLAGAKATRHLAFDLGHRYREQLFAALRVVPCPAGTRCYTARLKIRNRMHHCVASRPRG